MQPGFKSFKSKTPDFFDQNLPAALFGALAIIAVKNTLMFAASPIGDFPEAKINFYLTLAYYILTLVFTLQNTIFMLIRKPRKSEAASIQGKLIAYTGTFIIWLIIFEPNVITNIYALLAADLITLTGLLFTIYALNSLRIFFGLSPEARGIATTGAYKLVRHPMYLGEFITFLGILIPKLSPITFLVFVTFVALQITRALFEERVMAKTFPEYQAYRRHTPQFLPWPRPK